MNDQLTDAYPAARSSRDPAAGSSATLPRAAAPRRLAAAIRRALGAPGRLALGGGLLATGLAGPALGQSLELSDLDGANGFAINGIAAYDFSGFSVSSAGDVNGDGIDDVIIGASGADPSGFRSGQSYVVFGSSTGFPAALELSALDGTNGFAINGIAADDFSGRSVSNAGDVNGDGLDDVLIGAPFASPNGTSPNRLLSGLSYVVFGSSTGFPAALALSALDGANGFAINGIATRDGSGTSVSGAGDVNRDGLDDVLIGAFGADPNGRYSGQSYVVFGVPANPAALLEALTGAVETLGLPAGIETSLVQKLDGARKNLAQGHVAGATGKLQSFINEVRAQRAKKIPAAKADALIAQAQAILDRLT